MWAETIVETLSALDGAESEAAAFSILVDYAARLDANLVAYHHVAPPFARDHDNVRVLTSGFPDDWVKAYMSERLHRIDPIASYTAYQTRPVLWSDIPDRMRLTPEQAAYMEWLWAWLGEGEGLAVPAYGPSGRYGYFGIGRSVVNGSWSAAMIRSMHAVCDSFHMRFCELRLSGLAQDFELTDRETVILQGMARGWSDPMIGGAVGLRPDSLEGAIVRILRKMGVSDRPSAVLRARSLKLVDP